MESFNQIDERLTAWIDRRADEIVRTAQELIRIPSVKGEAETGAPFGVETVRALEYTLGIAAKHGLIVRNLDGYAGHAEWRSPAAAPDADIVGVLAHVDVVPEGDGWQHGPYGAEIDNGAIYGRGAVDDKGPAIAGLFAILAVAGCGVPASRRVRLILGCDEESGFGCVQHYFQHEEMPVTGFTPDGRFPVIHAEKGIANLNVELAGPLAAGVLTVESLAAGRRPNMVPDLAETTLTGPPNAIDAAFASLQSQVGLDAAKVGPDRISVRAKGVSAHGSKPEEGVNAFVVLCSALETAGLALSPALNTARNWAADTTGGALGIDGRDDVAGPLTSNLGVAQLADGILKLTFNIRYLVTWKIEDLLTRVNPMISAADAVLTGHSNDNPLYVPIGDPLLETLLSVYRSETQDYSPPGTMGGGTYARVMRRGVAFGPEFGKADGGAHQPDERWPIADLLRATRIYARAIARLAM